MTEQQPPRSLLPWTVVLPAAVAAAAAAAALISRLSTGRQADRQTYDGYTCGIYSSNPVQ